MRSVFAALIFLAALVLPASAAEVSFVRVWPAWRDAKSFERVSEFFTGKENQGGDIVLRTQANARSGYYFMTRVKNSGTALSNAKFSLQIIAPNDPQPKTFSFPATLKSGTSIFQLGLTGTDWTDPKNPPIAWKVELLQEDGRVVATAKSFLWEKPGK
jgi:hypothetical protein